MPTLILEKRCNEYKASTDQVIWQKSHRRATILVNKGFLIALQKALKKAFDFINVWSPSRNDVTIIMLNNN